MIEHAYAKVNLILRVCGRRPNGYHELAMVMETIDIHDDLEIAVSDEAGIHLSCAMEGPHLTDTDTLSTGEDNLVVRAAHAICAYAADHNLMTPSMSADRISDEIPGLDIHLTKRIPMAAGLAGGSTDAAATLRGINMLLNLGLCTETLCDIGVKLGADIPYCVTGGSRLATGIGDILTPIPTPPKTHLILVKPDIDVSTGHVYGQIDRIMESESAEIFGQLPEDRMISALTTGSIDDMADCLYNDLRRVTVNENPIIYGLETDLVRLGARGAMMSGSGPSVFALFEDRDVCMRALESIRGIYPDMYAEYTRFV